MNISGVGCTQQAATTSKTSALREQMDGVLSAVAKKLGMSDSDLQSALKSGKSLTDIAKSKGVSADDLTSTIKAALKSENPNLSDTQLTNIANRVLNHKVGGHHHHGGPPPAPPTADTSSSGVTTGTTATSGGSGGLVALL